MKFAGEVFGLRLTRLRRLDPLPFMMDRGRLAKKYPPAIRDKVKSWCAVVESIVTPPSASVRERLLDITGIDDGEELLFGLLFEHPEYLLLSGDKTAMRALRGTSNLEDIYQSLCGRVACVETVLRALLERVGIADLARAVGPMRPYNVMLNSIFSMGEATTRANCVAGFDSYILHLEKEVGPGFLLNL